MQKLTDISEWASTNKVHSLSEPKFSDLSKQLFGLSVEFGQNSGISLQVYETVKTVKYFIWN